MNKQPSLQPIIFIDLKKHRIRVHKQTLHLLKDPKYIQLWVNPHTRHIAIKRCNSRGREAHEVQLTNNICCELYSTELICTLQEVCSGLESNKGYRLYGKCSPDASLALFSMDDGIAFDEFSEEQRVL